MGVPGFFVWLLKNYNFVKTEIDGQTVDTLYLDANCLFHPQCFKVLEKYGADERLENKMFKRIERYIDYLITFCNPKSVYIAVDGVAPLAKMNQQRLRRYKSVLDTQMKNRIKERHNQNSDQVWNNTCITPGTEFMERLHERLLKFIEKSQIRIEYASYHVPGEGEHKILQDLKRKGDGTYVIYGLDADLIFLALASHKKNLFLLREEAHFGKKMSILNEDCLEEDLNYVPIDELRDCINRSLIDKGLKTDEGCDMSDDFIFICNFLGNDFLPHLPSININTGSLDVLIRCYIELFNRYGETMIVRDGANTRINNRFLKNLIRAVSKYEDHYFSKILPKYKERMEKRGPRTADPYQIEVWEMENLRGIKIHDPVRFGEPGYKQRYYEHYFGADDHQGELIDELNDQYFEGLMWVTLYYFDRCPSNNWQYNHLHAPFLSDMLNYKKDINSVRFPEDILITPFTQLLAVLPAQAMDLLPASHQQLMADPDSPIIDLFPIFVEQDMINKSMLWKCVPNIKSVNIKRVLEAVKNIKLNRNEIKRDKIIHTQYI